MWLFSNWFFNTIRFSDTQQIDCYVCSSFSESDPLCEDPFDPIASHHAPAAQSATSYNYQGQSVTPSNGSYLYLQRGCYGARKARITAFPATACLKLAGYFSKCNLIYQKWQCWTENQSSFQRIPAIEWWFVPVPWTEEAWPVTPR